MREEIEFGVAQRLDNKLAEQKSLLVNLSRGIDKLGGRRKSATEDAPQSAAQRLIAAIATQIKAHTSSKDLSLSGGIDRWRGVAIRAVVPPATSTTPGYAAELAQPALAGIFDLLTPDSAYSQLARRGMKIGMDGKSSVRLPTRSSSGDLAAAWLAEGAAIPVKSSGLFNVTLSLSKLGVIAFFTSELSERSLPTIESVLRAIMAEDVGNVLDSTMLGSGAGSASTPAGLLNGVTPLTAVTGGGAAACAGDISALLGAISPAADPVLVMSEAERGRMLGLCPGYAALPVVVSSAVGTKKVMAIDAAVLVTGEGDSPSIAISTDAVIHASDVPLPISATGSPNTIAAPSRSLYQEDLTAIRLVQRVGWIMRASGSVAVVNAVTW